MLEYETHLEEYSASLAFDIILLRHATHLCNLLGSSCHMRKASSNMPSVDKQYNIIYISGQKHDCFKYMLCILLYLQMFHLQCSLLLL